MSAGKGSLRVAAYCRVSTDGDDQANSFESQQRYFRAYIAQQPHWELAGIFADLIVTKEISRFARNTLDSIYYTRELKRLGVGVLFLSDNLCTLDGDAELRLAILSSIAQEESRRTSERVKWGQKRRMEQGVVFGRDLLGYDVRGGALYVNEAGARTVREIFRKCVDEGKGAHTIARELNEAGIPAARGGAWRSSVILRILRNEKYCGDLVQKKTYTPDYLTHEKKSNHGQEDYIIVRDHHTPIIPRTTFEAAGRILDQRAAAPAGQQKYSRRYPLSGKLRCGVCGAVCAARKKTRRDGTDILSWRCGNAVKYGRPHSDPNGRRGCTGESLRNADALQILSQVWASLPLDRDAIAADVLAAVRAVAPHEQADTIESEITAMLRGDTALTAQLLAQMTVYDRTHVTLTLRGFPGKWCFARTRLSKSITF